MMIKQFSILAFALLFVFGCADPVSVEDADTPVVQSERFARPADDFKRLTIADYLEASTKETGEFRILFRALEMTDLLGRLDDKRPLTVFAPTNKAFKVFLKEMGARRLEDVPVELLEDVLLYHMVRGRRVADIVFNSKKLETVLGQKVKVDAANTALIDVNRRSCRVVGTDIAPRNGIIHVLEAVMMPRLKPAEQ